MVPPHKMAFQFYWNKEKITFTNMLIPVIAEYLCTSSSGFEKIGTPFIVGSEANVTFMIRSGTDYSQLSQRRISESVIL